MVFIPATEGKPGQAASYYYNKISDTVLYVTNVYFTPNSRDPRTWRHHVRKGPLAMSQCGREMGRNRPHPQGIHIEAGDQRRPGWLLSKNFLFLGVNLSCETWLNLTKQHTPLSPRGLNASFRMPLLQVPQQGPSYQHAPLRRERSEKH